MVALTVDAFSVGHLFSAAGRPRFMAVFQAFFDAGGDVEDKQSRVLSVAGWIAPETKWRRLERDWNRVCEGEGVGGLHMKEFAHSVREFRDWKGDEERRGRFLSELAQIILKHTNRDFSQSTFLDGYRAVDAQCEFHERVGHPYAICALRCIQQVQDWMSKKHPHDDVMFVFEKGDAHQDEIVQMLRRDNIDLGIDPIFAEKRWRVGNTLRVLRPLECADFLAYEQHNVLTDIYLKAKTTARTSLWALQEKGAYFGVKGRGNSVLDGRFYDMTAGAMNLPRRVGVPRIPIPCELETLQRTMKDRFHWRGESRPIDIIPRRDPLPRLKGA